MEEIWNIVVMDYSCNTVTMYKEIKFQKVKESFDAESWIVNNTDHLLSNICWMSSMEEIEIIDGEVKEEEHE
jgi:hypothetical protein